METIAIILFGIGCFTLGYYTSTHFNKWLESRIEIHAKEIKGSEIKELSEKIEKFIKQLTEGN